jgi:hypothetical protein
MLPFYMLQATDRSITIVEKEEVMYRIDQASSPPAHFNVFFEESFPLFFKPIKLSLFSEDYLELHKGKFNIL